MLSSLSSEYIWSERAKRTVPRHPRSTPLGFSPNHQATPKTLSIVSPSSLWTDTLSKQTVQFVGLYIRSLKQVSDVSHERKTVSRVENAMDLFGHDSRKHPMLRHKKSRWGLTAFKRKCKWKARWESSHLLYEHVAITEPRVV